MAGGKWVLPLQFLYGAQRLAHTASGLNMFKILWCSTAQACRLNDRMLEMLKKMAGHWSGLCGVLTLCYLTDINVRNFCALSRCQQTSSRDGGRTLFAFFPPTVSLFWHLFPQWLILVWVALTGIADEHMQKRKELHIYTVKRGELGAQIKVSAAPTFPTALTFNEHCAKLHTWRRVTVDYVLSQSYAVQFVRFCPTFWEAWLILK